MPKIEGFLLDKTKKAFRIRVKTPWGCLCGGKTVWFPKSVCKGKQKFVIGKEVEFYVPDWFYEQKGIWG